MRVAIIDLGTNTFNLLISDIERRDGMRNPPFVKKVFKSKIAAKLGKDGITQRIIQPDAFQRGLDAMIAHKLTIERYRVERTCAFATSAIRDAVNGKDFTEAIHKSTGITIQIIDGDYEAALIYSGVKYAVELGKEVSLIMDIGGGSTEFILANDEKIFWKKSFQMGVTRLLEQFSPHDPMRKDEISFLESWMTEELKPLQEAFLMYPAQILVGSSGSFDSLADMIVNRYYTPSIQKGKTSYKFRLNDIHAIHRVLLSSTLAQRLTMKGLVEFRAENIVIASILIQLVLRIFFIKTVRLSKFSLREGVLWEMVEGKI